MFTQLRIHYPTCGFVTELVAINNGQYIVRCLVQNEGTTLVTGMAAAPTVELAEEQAKSRALTALGIVAITQTPETPVIAAPVSLSPTPTPITPTPVADTPVPTPTPVALTSVTETPVIPTKPDAKAHIKTQQSQLPEMSTIDEVNYAVESKAEAFPELTNPVADQELTFPFEFESTEVEASQSVETIDEMPQEVPSPAKDTPLTSDLELEVAQTSAVSAATPIDFSDIIARTNVQLKRLGWTNSQGRDYLVQTYGKRSRQLLTDAELLDFLQHLESEPSP